MSAPKLEAWAALFDSGRPPCPTFGAADQECARKIEPIGFEREGE
jgi:hypothetical protein